MAFYNSRLIWNPSWIEWILIMAYWWAAVFYIWYWFAGWKIMPLAIALAYIVIGSCEATREKLVRLVRVNEPG